MTYPIYTVYTGGNNEQLRMTCKYTSIRNCIHIYDKYDPKGHGKVNEYALAHTDSSHRAPKDLEEWLLCLPHPFGELAVKRAKEQPEYCHPGRYKQIVDPVSALTKGFNWSYTDEARTWAELSRFLKGAVEHLPEFPEIKKETKEMKRIYIFTENRPGLAEFVKSILSEKAGILLDRGPSNSEKFACFGNMQFWGTRFQTLEEYSEVSYAEFIKQISELPDKPKVKEPVTLPGFPVDSMNTVIAKETINIGCQTLTKEEWLALKEKVNAWRRTTIDATEEYNIYLTPGGIQIESYTNLIPWSDFDELSAEIEKFYQ